MQIAVFRASETFMAWLVRNRSILRYCSLKIEDFQVLRHYEIATVKLDVPRKLAEEWKLSCLLCVLVFLCQPILRSFHLRYAISWARQFLHITKVLRLVILIRRKRALKSSEEVVHWLGTWISRHSCWRI